MIRIKKTGMFGLMVTIAALPITGFPFLVKQAPFMLISTPFADVNVVNPFSVVIVNSCLIASSASSLNPPKAAAVGIFGVSIIWLSSSLLQLANAKVATTTNPMFFKFVLMIFNFLIVINFDFYYYINSCFYLLPLF